MIKRTTDGDGRATEPWRRQWDVAAPWPRWLSKPRRSGETIVTASARIGRDDLLDLTGFQNRHFDEEFEHLGPQLNSQSRAS